MKKLAIAFLCIALVLSTCAAWGEPALAQRPAAKASGTTYYVSSSAGRDGFDGLRPETALASINQVNSLDLQPGDRVLFQCGDTWRADPLVISRSGAPGQPITFGTYPANCANQPVHSGAQPISGWAPHATNIYVANLNAGANAGKFGYGVNQLFRGDERLPLGRWPNLDEGNAGYATIDSQPPGNQISDSGLPGGINWTGAVAHIRGMRWYILNRQVTGQSGQTLVMGEDLGCWDNDCTGWGYFLQNHLATLDREDEWFYDATHSLVYLYTASGAPPDGQIEGSVIQHDDDRSWGGVMLGEDMGEPVSNIVVENLDIRKWFRHGIATPTNLHPSENHDVTLRNNTIADVDGIGINLMTWVWDANDGRPDGWRGGYNHTVSDNLIERANSMGINTATRNSTFSGNTIRDVGRIQNLGVAGLGCGFDGWEGACTEDGDGIRIKIDRPDDSGHTNTFSANRLERIAHNGFDVFGHHNTFEYNVIVQACITKGDCGGVRTFGRDSLGSTPVYNLTFRQNVIVDTIGNTDGCNAEYKTLFGFGLYIDNYSRDVTLANNVLINSTASGILYQNSTGSMTGNILYGNSSAFDWAAQVWVTDDPSYVNNLSGNVMYGLNPNAWTLGLENAGRLGSSDYNYFFNPYHADHIRGGDNNYSLAAWQAASGKDAHSKEAWFSDSPGTPPRSHVFYNDTGQTQSVNLGSRLYLDLDQQNVSGSLSLQPYSAVILVDSGVVPLTLTSIYPTLVEWRQAADFTLSVRGLSFTAQSVVRWNGEDRPTTFVSDTELHAAISAVEVGTLSTHAITVYDPANGGTQTPPLYLWVVDTIRSLYMPLVMMSQ